MTSPFTSPRKSPSPVPPTHSLFGLEKVVPPDAVSHENLLLQSHGRSLLISPSNLDKPLPIQPGSRRTSSVYSGDSGYTKIVASYEDREEDVPPLLYVAHPKPVRGDTVSTFLDQLSARAYSPASISSIPATRQTSRRSRSIPSLRLEQNQWRALSAFDNKSPSSSVDFSRKSTGRKGELLPPRASEVNDRGRKTSDLLDLPSPMISRSSCSVSSDYDRHLPAPISGRIAEIIDPEMVPAPLRINRSRKSVVPTTIPGFLIPIEEAQRRAEAAKLEYLSQHPPKDEKSSSRDRRSFRSFSSDSFIIYTGVRESLKAMIKDTMRQRREAREAREEAKKRERVSSTAEEKYLGKMEHNRPPDSGRKFSFASSRKDSLRESVNSLMRALSISSTNDTAVRGRPRERGPRPRQLAIPITPYQKYGAEVWFAKNKKKRADTKRAAGGIHVTRIRTRRTGARYESRRVSQKRTGRNSSQELRDAFHNGRNQLLNVLEGPKHLLTRTSSDKRRSKLKSSIAMVGPARQPTMRYARNWM